MNKIYKVKFFHNEIGSESPDEVIEVFFYVRSKLVTEFEKQIANCDKNLIYLVNNSLSGNTDVNEYLEEYTVRFAFVGRIDSNNFNWFDASDFVVDDHGQIILESNVIAFEKNAYKEND